LVQVSKNSGCNRSATDVINTESETRICTPLKSDFYFRFHWPLKSQHCLVFTLYIILCWWVKKCDDQSLNTAKIGICTSLKAEFYFWFVLQTVGIKPTILASCVQYLVKIGKELLTTADLLTNTWTDKTGNVVYPMHWLGNHWVYPCTNWHSNEKHTYIRIFITTVSKPVNHI